MTDPDLHEQLVVIAALRERLAALAHDQWSGWMRYMAQFVVVDGEGRWLLDADKAARWTRQMQTTYADLSEQEKESDRVEADKVLTLLAQGTGGAHE